jgi:hypothetical protein
MLKVVAVLLLAALAHTVVAADADNDGVEDAKDLCPQSTRGSREHVDISGCEHDQVDFDLDGWCNPGMPLINKKPFTTRHDFCIGKDNCKFVKNPGQEQNYPADNGNDADGSGDACNTGACALRRCARRAVCCFALCVVWEALRRVVTPPRRRAAENMP